MNNKSIFLAIIALLMLAMTVSGCSGLGNPAPAAVVETQSATATLEEEEAAGDLVFEFPAGDIVTSIEQIEGTWIAAAYPGNFVLQIFPDGTLSVATSLEDLRAGNTDSWQLTIEDGEITASGYALCLGEVGSYIGTLKYNGLLRFTSIIDSCDPRLRKMDRSLPGRLNEYILIYYPVE